MRECDSECEYVCVHVRTCMHTSMCLLVCDGNLGLAPQQGQADLGLSGAGTGKKC